MAGTVAAAVMVAVAAAATGLWLHSHTATSAMGLPTALSQGGARPPPRCGGWPELCSQPRGFGEALGQPPMSPGPEASSPIPRLVNSHFNILHYCTFVLVTSICLGWQPCLQGAPGDMPYCLCKSLLLWVSPAGRVGQLVSGAFSPVSQRFSHRWSCWDLGPLGSIHF